MGSLIVVCHLFLTSQVCSRWTLTSFMPLAFLLLVSFSSNSHFSLIFHFPVLSTIPTQTPISVSNTRWPTDLVSVVDGTKAGYNDIPDLHAIDYSGFGVIAIKAIQEQQQIIQQQQKQIEELNKRLEAIERKNN